MPSASQAGNNAVPKMIPLLVCLLLPLGAAAEQSPQALARLIVDFSAFDGADDPFTAAAEGDDAALSLLPDVTAAADGQRDRVLKAFQRRLDAIADAGLTPAQRLNRDLLRREIRERLAELQFDTARMPFSNDSGFHTRLAEQASFLPMRGLQDAEAWLKRLDAAPGYYQANLDNIRRGLSSGFLQPRPVAELIARQAREQADRSVDNDPLLAPLNRLPISVSAEQAAELRARARRLIAERLRPAQFAFADLMEKEYLPAAREQLGARMQPDGQAYYRWLVAHHTTTDLDPDQVHALGLHEVARIRAEMEKQIRSSGFQEDFPSFLAFLRSDPRFYVDDRQKLLEKVSEIAKRIDDQLPGHFGRLPRLTYGVRPVPAEIEENYTSGRYFEGSPARGIAGGLMINTSHLDQRPLFEMPALALHEGVPGHHLQIALAQELTDLPAFRRHAYVTAFVEGWGLYAEQLGTEMGIYRDPYEVFGQLSFEMWRACRLVADTGLHWLGWSRDQATACFTENTALSPANIESEVLRYISWPGQALAYKIGELKIVELRRRAEQQLGNRFDERTFHDEVLLAGPLPLDLLEARVDRWLRTQRP